MRIPSDLGFQHEVDQSISQLMKEIRKKDALSGSLRCPKCNSKLRYTIHGRYFCPKCLRYIN